MSLLRRILSTLAVGSLLAVAVPTFAEEVAAAPAATTAVASDASALDPRYQEPHNYAEAADEVMFSVQLYKTGYWVGFALAISQLLIFVMKRLEQTYAKVKKYGTFVVLGLSAVAGLLSLVVGGMKWPEAILVFLGTVAPKVLADLLTELGITPHTKNPDGTPAEQQ